MSANDRRIVADGVAVQGLHDRAELEKVRAFWEKELENHLERNQPMLKGSGFIVIDAQAPRFDGEEYVDFAEAQQKGSDVAYKNGCAIIYAPMLVMRPERPTANSTPSKLLQQLVSIAGNGNQIGTAPVADIPVGKTDAAG